MFFLKKMYIHEVIRVKKDKIMRYFKFIIVFLIILGCQKKMPDEYIIRELYLVPEGIDYSAGKDAFYLTSIAQSKIIKIDRKTGKQEDFIGTGEYGYTPGAGVFIDNKKSILYAIGGYYMFSDSLSSLFAFDLNSGQLINRYNVEDTGEHFLNDMVMDKNGNIYMTNSKDSSIYILEQGSNSLKLFFKSTEIQYPNGIAISDDNAKLYIATYYKGIRSLDIEKRAILNEIDTVGYSQRIDGLEFYKGHLYGIQKGSGDITNNFRKLILNEKQNKIIKEEIIDSHNPDLSKPLTFCIVDNRAIVIGNSNLEYLDQVKFTFKETGSMLKTKLLVYNLE